VVTTGDLEDTVSGGAWRILTVHDRTACRLPCLQADAGIRCSCSVCVFGAPKTKTFVEIFVVSEIIWWIFGSFVVLRFEKINCTHSTPHDVINRKILDDNRIENHVFMGPVKTQLVRDGTAQVTVIFS
jgi:hypothetical protein